MTTRTCVACGSPITVTTRNPNRRFCSPRCRAVEWHARNRTNDVVNGANDAADAAHTPDDVHNAVRAANGTARCPHCATNWPSSPSSSPPTPPTSKHRR
jgi:endogenous inhibitor of DNA gyrase (YacG/DUF329 family)